MSSIEKHNTSSEPVLVSDIKIIIEQGRRQAYASVNEAMINTYWQIGRRIVEQEQQGSGRAGYGKNLLKTLSSELTHEYGGGFSERYLAYFRKFYLTVPDITILQTRLQNLRWSHILTVLRVDDEVARRWYLETTSEQMWSVRTLNRNISTQYYERHYARPTLVSECEADKTPQKEEILKSPVVAEFLGLKQDESINERELETSIISHLQDFLMEMGRGFAAQKATTPPSALCYAPRPMPTSHDILSSRATNNSSPPNTNLCCLPKSNCAVK